jgi:hypothetical protein
MEEHEEFERLRLQLIEEVKSIVARLKGQYKRPPLEEEQKGESKGQSKRRIKKKLDGLEGFLKAES